jgi:hypothetical protein
MRRRPFQGGFTSAELLVAGMIAAVVIGTAAMAFGTLSRGQRQFTTMATVNLPTGASNNFYGIDSTSITAHVAPNFGAVAQAEAMRERFCTETSQAIAVYCLYRGNNVWNTVHPTTIATPPFGTAMDTPEAFRAYLATAIASSSGLFTTYRNYGVTPNVSIFVLGYSTDAATIPVIAVYDMDLVAATDPNNAGVAVGTYASVRRYAAGTLTNYYDVIYRASGGADSWTPPVVAFERKSRLAVAEGSSIDPFKVAAGRPFYFIFWPDPAEDSLALPSDVMTGGVLNGSFASTDPRRVYNHMAGRTSFMFTVPVFPSF